MVFTRIFRSISSLTHRSGIRLYRYLDDWLIAAQTEEDAVKSTQWVLDLCVELGLFVNFGKSDIVPPRRATYLGMRLDTSFFTVRLTERRLNSIHIY